MNTEGKLSTGRYAAHLLAALTLTAGIASAGTITAGGVDYNRGGGLMIQEDGVTQNAYFAGVIFITLVTNGTTYQRDSLCVDLFTDIFIGVTYNTQLLRPDEVAGKNLGRVSWLIDNALLPTQDLNYLSALPSSDLVTTSAQGAGIQLAVWDIVHDAGDGFSLGRVQAATGASPTDAAVLAWAQHYEAVSLGKSSDLAFIYNNVDMGNGAPAQMLAGPKFTDNGPAPAPEPSTGVLAVAGAVVATFAKRKFSSQ